jgi:glycosyltransferase involved in cell wall biosynthesis
MILNVNGFKANKNLITLLEAFARLSTDFPDWNIKVIGKAPDGNEPHKKKIREFIRQNELTDRVVITGPTDKVFEHYTNAHIHAIASLSEGCPTVVLEAMSVGLPSIGFADCPGTNQLINHDSNGLLASPEDRIAGFEAELRKLMCSPDLRKRLGTQALKDSRAFSPKRIYDQWEQLFCEAAEYKNDPERLFHEQLAVNPERALHAKRMRKKIMKQIKGTL